MLIDYARTSTVEQVAGLEAQRAALDATGCSKLFSEQASSVAQRDQLVAVLDWVREGDTLVVTRLDRLARSTADLLGIVATLEAKRVALRILDFGGSEVDTRSPTGRMLLTMFTAVAEFALWRPSSASRACRVERAYNRRGFHRPAARRDATCLIGPPHSLRRMDASPTEIQSDAFSRIIDHSFMLDKMTDIRSYRISGWGEDA